LAKKYEKLKGKKMAEVKDLTDQLSLEDQAFINSLEDVTVSFKELNQQENNIIAQLKSEFSLFKVISYLIKEAYNLKIKKKNNQ
jgi:hypothetical protein